MTPNAPSMEQATQVKGSIVMMRGGKRRVWKKKRARIDCRPSFYSACVTVRGETTCVPLRTRAAEVRTARVHLEVLTGRGLLGSGAPRIDGIAAAGAYSFVPFKTYPYGAGAR